LEIFNGAIGSIARAFVDARRSGTPLADYPGPFPTELEDAYAVQDAAIALQGEPVGGWKVGRINPPLDARYGTSRLAGPIFAPSIFAEESSPIAMSVFAGGFAAAEAEFLLRIGTAPAPGKTDYTLREAAGLIDAVHAGIEIASSPYPGINARGPAVTISDFGNNKGLVVGRAINDWRDAVRDWPLALAVNGAVVGTGIGRDMLDGPLGAAAFLFNLSAARGVTLTAGQWISSGAVTGVHPVRPGQIVEARFADAIAVRCTITAI
jgi:2-keto-4-pentenoate hydratase